MKKPISSCNTSNYHQQRIKTDHFTTNLALKKTLDKTMTSSSIKEVSVMESSPSMPSFGNNNTSPHLPLSAKNSYSSGYRRASLVPVAVVAAGPLSLSGLFLTDRQFHPERFTALLEGKSKDDFLKRLQDLQSTCRLMSQFFHEYDFQGVSHNGFRSFVKLVMMYLDNVEKLLNDQASVRFTTSSSTRKTNRALKEYEAASHLLIHQIKVLMMIRDRDVKGTSNETTKNCNHDFNSQPSTSSKQGLSPESETSHNSVFVDANETVDTDDITLQVSSAIIDNPSKNETPANHDSPSKQSLSRSLSDHSKMSNPVILSDEQMAIFFEMLAVDSDLLMPFFSGDLRNFWLHPHSRRIMDVFLSRTISKLVPFHQSIWLNLFDSEGKKNTAINYTLNATISDQMKVWSLMEDNVMKALTAIKFIGSSGRVDWFTLGRQSQVVFSTDGKLNFRTPDQSSSQESTSGKLLSNKYPLQGMLVNYNVKKPISDGTQPDSLIFHCHGGGFVCMTPKGHESYLRYWSQQTKVPVLCVNYGKAPLNPFPCGLQDLLDAFLFITSGREEVVKILGFHPKNIIVTGDSAGGNLALALTLALEKVKSTLNPNQVLPRAIFVQYPCGDPSVTVNASRTFISFDPLLTIAAVFSIGSAYSGVDNMKMMQDNKVNGDNNYNDTKEKTTKIEDTTSQETTGNASVDVVKEEPESLDSTNNQEDHDRNTNTDAKSFSEISANTEAKPTASPSAANEEQSESSTATSNNLPWFRRSRKEVISVANAIAVKSTDPYFNPLSCSSIPDVVVKNIPLLIQASEFDPLLDDSIGIAKWYSSQGGSVVLDVVEGVQHGFMIAIGHKSLQPAVDVSVTRIKQGLGILPFLGLKTDKDGGQCGREDSHVEEKSDSKESPQESSPDQQEAGQEKTEN